MAMQLACHHSEHWLRQTARAWLGNAIRHKSTLSAINRGLKITKRASDARQGTHKQDRTLRRKLAETAPTEASQLPAFDVAGRLRSRSPEYREAVTGRAKGLPVIAGEDPEPSTVFTQATPGRYHKRLGFLNPRLQRRDDQIIPRGQPDPAVPPVETTDSTTTPKLKPRQSAKERRKIAREHLRAVSKQSSVARPPPPSKRVIRQAWEPGDAAHSAYQSPRERRKAEKKANPTSGNWNDRRKAWWKSAQEQLNAGPRREDVASRPPPLERGDRQYAPQAAAPTATHPPATAKPHSTGSDRHPHLLATVMLYLRRARDSDLGFNLGQRELHLRSLKEAIAEINHQSRHLIAIVETELSAQSLGTKYGITLDVPACIRGGETPPAVERTAIWIRPNNTLAVAEPSSLRTPIPDPGVSASLRRLGFLVGEIQRLESGGLTGPVSDSEIVEAQRLIAFATRHWSPTREDSKTRLSKITQISRCLGGPGCLWTTQPGAIARSHLFVGGPNWLELVIKPAPNPAMPAPRDDSSPAPTSASEGVLRHRESNQPNQAQPDGEDVPLAIPRESNQQNQAQPDDEDVPLAIPYTTAAATFMYGSNAVLAALRANRRRFYHLYLHSRAGAREENFQTITNLASKLHLKVTKNADLRLLDKMSADRPHNGVVLEASHAPAPPVLALGKPDRRTAIIPLVLSRQSAEDVAVNGAPAAFPTLTKSWRHPLVLMLDGITDEGNLGNILRTAHFYGVDAVAVATNTCAPLTSAIMAKASSGACEAVRVLALPKPSSFVHDSAKNGWRIHAAVAPAEEQRPKELRRPNDYARNLTTAAVGLDSPLARHPVILMMGAEGEGLRENLRRQANHFVTIERGGRAVDVGEESVDVGVDSLNVGVATGVLVEAFMRKPEGASEVGELGF